MKGISHFITGVAIASFFPEVVHLAQEGFRASRVRFTSGVAIGSDVLEAESLQVRATRNCFNAHYDAILAQLRLMHITGDL